MNLEDLRAAQTRERATDGLQELRESFYGDVAEYIEELKEQREAAAAAADDPFGDPEVQELTDKIETAEQVAEAIYERRMGKLVKQASLAAAGMPDDADGLTAEERDLYEDLVERIEANKNHVLDVVAGEADTAAGDDVGPERSPVDAAADSPESSGSSSGREPSSGREAEPGRGASSSADAASDSAAAGDPSDTSAAAAMGGGLDGAEADDGSAADEPRDDGQSGAGEAPADEPRGTDGPAGDEPQPGGRSADAEPPDAVADDLARVSGEDADADRSPADGGDPGAGEPSTDEPSADEPAGEDVDRTTVRVTDDVGEIFGMDEREYTLEAEDVVTLPEENAAPLVEKDAAEKLD